MGWIYHRREDNGACACAAEDIGEVVVAGDDDIGDRGGGAEAAGGSPGGERAARLLVVHHRVIDIVKNLASVLAQQTSIGRIEKLALEDDGVVIAGGCEEFSPRQKPAR